MIMDDLIRSELECTNVDKPEFGPVYQKEEFENWSTNKWVMKTLLDKIDAGEDPVRAVEQFQSKMLIYSSTTKDQDNRSSFYDAYLYCEYLLTVYCEILSDKQLEDMYGYV